MFIVYVGELPVFMTGVCVCVCVWGGGGGGEGGGDVVGGIS